MLLRPLATQTRKNLTSVMPGGSAFKAAGISLRVWLSIFRMKSGPTDPQFAVGALVPQVPDQHSRPARNIVADAVAARCSREDVGPAFGPAPAGGKRPAGHFDRYGIR